MKAGAPAEPSPAEIRALRRSLGAWFAANRRPLPWRGSPTPYEVWVSEVMLQQTRVDVVEAYYSRWMARLPTIEALASAAEDDVLGLWQGLGYYSRARRLLAGARFVVREKAGLLPSDPLELLEVPGIGPYSAGAIASIAHQKRAPLVDGNVVRVLSRVFGLAGDPAKAPLKTELWRRAEALVPHERPGDFNQALMELGALVCTPKSPSCLVCPWRGRCVAFQAGEATRYPEKPKRRAPTAITGLVLIVRHRGAYALERLPHSARWWAGLDALPSVELGDATRGALSRFWADRAGASATGLGLRPTRRALERLVLSLVPGGGASVLPPLSHQVTRFKIELRPVLVELVGKRPNWPGHAWVRASDLRGRALPSPHRQLLSALLAKRATSRIAQADLL